MAAGCCGKVGSLLFAHVRQRRIIVRRYGGHASGEDLKSDDNGHVRVGPQDTVAQPRSHGPEEGSIPPLPSQERAPYRITRSGKRGRQRYQTKGTVYLPATTVPPTVVALRPKKGGNDCVGPIPLMGIGPRRRPTNITKYNARQVPQCGK